MSGLERALETLAEDSDDAEKLWHNYRSVKTYLEEEYYPWIQANCPYFTDHGKGHIDAVLSKASKLLAKDLENPVEGDLTHVDIFVLLAAIIWHDVGMVKHREDHAERVTEIIDEIQQLAFPNPGIRRLVESIVRAHSGKDGLGKAGSENMFDVRGDSYEISPVALAAILRFADEISESQSRVANAPVVVETVPEESKIFWKYAQTIAGCAPDLRRNQIIVNVQLNYEEAMETYPCPDRYEDRADNGEISLMEYVVCRLEKMNNEKAYCAPEFRKYVTIRSIEARITLFEEGGSQRENVTKTYKDARLRSHENYPNSDIYASFFDEYSHLKPSVDEEDGDGSEKDGNGSEKDGNGSKEDGNGSEENGNGNEEDGDENEAELSK